MATLSSSLATRDSDRRQYGSHQLGGKSIALVASYGVDTRPTKVERTTNISGEANTHTTNVGNVLPSERGDLEGLYGIDRAVHGADCAQIRTMLTDSHVLHPPQHDGQGSTFSSASSASSQIGTDEVESSFQRYFDFDQAASEEYTGSVSEVSEASATAHPQMNRNLVRLMHSQEFLTDSVTKLAEEWSESGLHTATTSQGSGTCLCLPSTAMIPENVLPYTKQNPWAAIGYTLFETTGEEKRAASAPVRPLSE